MRIFPRIVLLAIGCIPMLPAQAQLVTTVGASKNPKAAELYTQALALTDNGGDILKARNLYDQALSIDPNFGKAYANRACARFNTKDYRGAIEDCDKAFKWYPNLATLVDIRQRAVNMLNNPDGGGGGGNDLAARQAKAREMIRQAQMSGDYTSAGMITRLANTVAAGARAQQLLHPQQPVDNTAAATVSGKNNPFGGHADAAGPIKGQSSNNSPFGGKSNASPFSGQSGNALGSTESSSSGSSPFGGQDGNALGGAGETAATSNQSARDYFQKGCVKNQAQDFMGAIEQFNHAIELDQTNGECYANRGLARFHLMNFKGALEDFQKADSLIPNNKELKHYIEMCTPLAK